MARTKQQKKAAKARNRKKRKDLLIPQDGLARIRWDFLGKARKGDAAELQLCFPKNEVYYLDPKRPVESLDEQVSTAQASESSDNRGSA